MAETTREIAFTLQYPYNGEHVYKFPMGQSVNFDTIKNRVKQINQHLPKTLEEFKDPDGSVTLRTRPIEYAYYMKQTFVDVDETTTEITEDNRVNGIKDIKLTVTTTETIYER